jgi:dolichyl-phosphate beta-glucosyltransferase
MNPQLSLIIPSYNDRERTLRSCKICVEYMASHQINAEIIIVDDGSDPQQAIHATDVNAGVRILRNPKNLGKGGAIRHGVLEARGEIIVFTDSDLPFTLEPLPQTIELLNQGYDIVIGDRLHPKSECRTAVSWMRRISSQVFTFLVNAVIGLPFRDTQCGYKGYRAVVAKELFKTGLIQSFSFDVEILLIAFRRGYRIATQPIYLVNNETTTVRLGRHGREIIRDILRIRLYDLMGRYR